MNDYNTRFDAAPELLGSSELAELLGVSRNTAIRMMRQPGFPLLLPWQRRNRRVNKYQLRSWMRGGRG